MKKMLSKIPIILCLVLVDAIAAQFIEMPHNRQVKINSTATMKCIVGVNKELDVANYSWYLNNKIIANNEHFHLNGNTLKIKNAQKHLAGYYNCIIAFERSGAKLETPYELLVVNDRNQHQKRYNDEDVLKSNFVDSLCSFKIPKLCRNKRNKEEELLPMTVNESTPVTMECKIADVKQDYSIRWLKDGKELANEQFDLKLTNTTQSKTLKYSIDPVNYKLTIVSAMFNDEGIYDCAMFNDKDEFIIKSKQRYSLQIKVLLKFTPKPTSKHLELGSTSKIHCKASGNPKIVWSREMDELLPENVDDVNGTLIFNNVTLEHKGKYSCHASIGDENIHASIQVNIVVAPKFEVSPPSAINVVEYQPVFLDCIASGSPEPTVRWDYNSKQISTTVEGDDDRFKIFENGTLVLNEARQEDEGRYGCTIGNAAGLKREETVLTIKPMDSHSSFEDAAKENGFVMTKAVLITIIVALAYIFMVVALMLWCRYKRQKSRSEDPENKDTCDDTASDGDEEKPLKHELKTTNHKPNKVVQIVENNSKPKPPSSPSSTLIIDHLMIKREKLIDLIKLGRGEFGEILAGTILEQDLPKHGVMSNDKDVNEIQALEKMPILVKSLSKIKDESFYTEFRRQIDLFRAVDSIHVTKLIGLSYEQEHHLMVLEHAEVGDLKQFLLGTCEVSLSILLTFCLQITKGLAAMAKTKLTHRDLACRNCIITTNSIVKISCIALSKDKYSNEYFKHNNKAIPLRHLAPEILDSGAFSLASDLYACGFVLWEVLSRGALPFDELVPSDDEFLQQLSDHSLDYTSFVENEKIPNDLRKVLLKCCSITPSERPSPEDLLKSLEDLLKNEETVD